MKSLIFNATEFGRAYQGAVFVVHFAVVNEGPADRIVTVWLAKEARGYFDPVVGRTQILVRAGAEAQGVIEACTPSSGIQVLRAMITQASAEDSVNSTVISPYADSPALVVDARATGNTSCAP